MKRTAIRDVLLPILLAAGFIFLDLIADRHIGGFGQFGLPHVVLAVSVLVVSYILTTRAREHAVELEQVNQALRREVAERKRVGEELTTSEETARALINAFPATSLLIDPQGIILATNKTVGRNLGVTDEQLLGGYLFDFFPADVAERRRKYLETILQSRRPLQFVDEWAGRTFDNHVHPVFDTDGAIIKLAIFSQNITARVQTEALLRETAERLEYTQAAAGAGSWDWEISSGRFDWSAKLFELFGLDPQTTVASYEAWRSVIHPDDREAAEERITLALAAHSKLQSEYRIILPDGQIRWISALGRAAYDEEDRPIRISGICLDITGRKLGQARIQHLSSFPELNPNPVVEINASGDVIFHNPAAMAAVQRLGLSDDVRVFLPGDLEMILRELDGQKDSRFQREVHVGSVIFAETIHVIPASGVVRIYGFDITERVRAQEALAANEEKYRLLFQNMAEGFALYELLDDEQGNPADWRVLEVNEAYQRHTGIARDQIAGRRISELFPAAIPEYLPAFVTVVDTQTPTEFETYARAVGRHQHVSTFPAGGRRFASIIEDITRRKQSEEALRQAQAELALDVQKRSSLEERQRLARELHDSVSQALYGISLGVHTALTQFDADRAKARAALDYTLSLAHAGLTEMRALIFELRPESLEKEGLVAALARHAEALRARHRIEVDLSLCEEPDVSLSVKEALYRIAQEALQNAVKHAHPDRLDVRLICSPEGIRLEVCDDGAGFDPSVDHPGHLGLQSMRERALNLGGALDIVSDYGCGTQIYVVIPVA